MERSDSEAVMHWQTSIRPSSTAEERITSNLDFNVELHQDVGLLQGMVCELIYRYHSVVLNDMVLIQQTSVMSAECRCYQGTQIW